jgi:hypothetical protein
VRRHSVGKSGIKAANSINAREHCVARTARLKRLEEIENNEGANEIVASYQPKWYLEASHRRENRKSKTAEMRRALKEAEAKRIDEGERRRRNAIIISAER